MKKIFFAIVAGALFLSSVPGNLVAADKDSKKHMDPYVQGPGDETGLIREVRHRLVMLPYYGVFDDLGFTVNGSTVTLEGQVAQPVLKDDAERTVKKIEGVNKVVNNIEVLPLSPNDDRIRRAVYRAIFADENFATRYGFSAVPSIHIIVKNGNVRLEGVVSSEFDRNLAGMKANGVPGAFSVVNDLRVEGKSQS
jgi:hyperosmotically inducible protein